MRSRYLSTAILLLLIHSASAEDLTISLSRSEIFVTPGDRVNLTIRLENLASHEVEVKGFELRVFQHIPLFPSGIQLGTYELPLDEPIELKPGEARELSKVFEIPRIAYSGEFSILVIAKTSVGERSCELRVSLGLSPSSALSTAITLLIEAGIIFVIYKALRMELRPMHMTWRRIRRLRIVRGWREYDREVVSIMDERRAWGTFRDGMRYERHLDAIKKADELISAVMEDLREEERKLEREVRIMRSELGNLEGRLSEAQRNYLLRILNERERMLRELRSLITDLERGSIKAVSMG